MTDNAERPEAAARPAPKPESPGPTAPGPTRPVVVNESSRVHSEQFGEIAGALAKAQLKIGNAEKNAENPHFKRTYADLASVREACRVALAENGIAVSQVLRTNARGNMVMSTMLLHTSNQWIGGDVEFEVTRGQPQVTGSHITYMKRYAMAAIVAVATADEDDDGEGATGRGAQPPGPQGRGSSSSRREEPRGRDDRPRDEPRARGGDDRQGPPPERPARPGPAPAPAANASAPPATPPAQPPAQALAQTPPAAGEKPKTPTYPADLAGEEKAIYDGLLERMKSVTTKIELGAVAADIAKLPYQEGSAAYAYIHWSYDWMSNRIAKAGPSTRK